MIDPRRGGRYEIIREIARGGFAVVYLATQLDLDRSVALKELSAFQAADRSVVERFLRESRMAGSLNHPNIVTVHEYFEHEGTPYISMEYLERGALRAVMGRLTLPQIVGVLEGLLAGLAHGEKKGIVHRDLKPENLMISTEGNIKIADFGIAKAAKQATEALTATGMTIGTPTYMAPEQAMARPVGPWTDLYSAGVIAYELFLGQVPFEDAEAPVAVLYRHVHDPIPPPLSVNPDLNPGLADWIERLLKKEPADRYQRALEAWEELEEIVIEMLGPRWRRQARLLEAPDGKEGDRAVRSLSPAPFPKKSPPAVALAPFPERGEVAEPEVSGFETFAPKRERDYQKEQAEQVAEAQAQAAAPPSDAVSQPPFPAAPDAVGGGEAPADDFKTYQPRPVPYPSAPAPPEPKPKPPPVVPAHDAASAVAQEAQSETVPKKEAAPPTDPEEMATVPPMRRPQDSSEATGKASKKSLLGVPLFLWIVLVVVLAAGGVGLASFMGKSEEKKAQEPLGQAQGTPEGPPPSPLAPSETIPLSVTVETQDNKFAPTNIKLKQGGTISFKNTGRVPHNAVTKDGSIGIPLINPGEEKSVTVSQGGTLDLVCQFHETLGMAGTITLEDGSPRSDALSVDLTPRVGHQS